MKNEEFLNEEEGPDHFTDEDKEQLKINLMLAFKEIDQRGQWKVNFQDLWAYLNTKVLPSPNLCSQTENLKRSTPLRFSTCWTATRMATSTSTTTWQSI